MWVVSYQKLMSILLSSRYIPEKDKKKDEDDEILDYMKTVQNKYNK